MRWSVIVSFERLTLDEVRKRMFKTALTVPVRRKTLKMMDGVELCAQIFGCGHRRIAVFKTYDAELLRDSVLYEVFLSVGGDVCAYSAHGAEYRIKVFSPLD